MPATATKSPTVARKAEYILAKIEGVRTEISKTMEWLEDFHRQAEEGLAKRHSSELKELERTWARAEWVLEDLNERAPKPKLPL